MDWNLPPITKHQYVVAIYGSIVVMMHNDGYLTNNNWLVVSISVEFSTVFGILILNDQYFSFFRGVETTSQII